jgi:hypothetical protein
MSKAVECHRRNPVDASDLPVPRDTEIVRFDWRAIIVTEHQGIPLWSALPSLSLSSSCWRRCCSSSRAALGGKEIVLLPCLVFGSLNRRPALVCSRDRPIRTLLASTSDQHRAKSSPIRQPVARPSEMMGYSLCSFRASLTALIWWGSISRLHRFSAWVALLRRPRCGIASPALRLA